nr:MULTISPECIES: transposase [unclassified Streptococcus]
MVNCEPLSSYRQLDKAQPVGCWAHVRRKFFEAIPKKTDKTSLAAKELAYFDRLFALENDWADLSSEERLHKHQTELAPLMDDFFDWCRKQAVLLGSKLGAAMEYCLKYEATFRTILSDGNFVLSNNIAGRAMKPLVMGHKNWLFSQSFEGAKSIAIILSLLETAKRCGLDSEK